MGVTWGVSDFLQIALQSLYVSVMVLPLCLNFDYPNFGEMGAPRGSTMVSLGRELVSSHRLSIQTTLVSGRPTV